MLLPFIVQTYPDHHQFYEDNDPKHTSRWAQWFFAEKGINWWTSPPESPDLPKNLPELEAAVEHYWQTKLTIIYMNTSIVSMVYSSALYYPTRCSL